MASEAVEVRKRRFPSTRLPLSSQGERIRQHPVRFHQQLEST